MENIYMIGFMGAGKSTIAKALSEKTARPLVELDEEIEGQQGCTIGEIFQSVGEEGFRSLETKALAKTQQEKGRIISCGGGIVLKKENRKILKESGFCIFLTAEASVLVTRLKDSTTRPLLQENTTLEEMKTMLQERESFYRECAHLTIDTGQKSVESILEEIEEYTAAHEDSKRKQVEIYQELRDAATPWERGKILESVAYRESFGEGLTAERLRWNSRYYYTDKQKKAVGDKYVWLYLTMSIYKGTKIDKKHLRDVLARTLEGVETREFAEKYPEEYGQDLQEGAELYISTLEAPPKLFGLFGVKDNFPEDTTNRVAALLLNKHFPALKLVEDSGFSISPATKGLYLAVKNNRTLFPPLEKKMAEHQDQALIDWMKKSEKKD